MMTPHSSNSSSTSRKLRQKRKYSHVAWLMISPEKRWFLYRLVGTGGSCRNFATQGVSNKLTTPWRGIAVMCCLSLCKIRQHFMQIDPHFCGPSADNAEFPKNFLA